MILVKTSSYDGLGFSLIGSVRFHFAPLKYSSDVFLPHTNTSLNYTKLFNPAG